MAVWLSVRNETRESVLPVRVRECRSILCRSRGLTFRRRLPQDEALLLVGKRQSRIETAIHMFFVFFPIAVIWLDQDGQVVDTCLARPFRPLYAPRSAARDVLEGSPSLLDWVTVGDRLNFELE